MQKEAAVIIPYYRNELTLTERISLDRCKKILGIYPIYFVVPDLLEVDESICPVEQIIRVSDAWMSGVTAYNQMMMNIDFYHLFEDYEYILLYQLDAYVFSDRLAEFCAMGYDYIGAPWQEGKFDIEHEENGIVYVGNGGFSLRKVASFISVLKNCDRDFVTYNEDLFWGSRGAEGFKVAPVDIATDFAFERPVRVLYESNNNQLPFGCHAWMKYDFNFFRPYLLQDGYRELQDYIPPFEYDKHNKYIEQRFMLADEMQILRAIHEFTEIVPNTIYIYGASAIGKTCGYLLMKVRNREIIYLDRNESRWKDTLYNFPIVSPENAKANDGTIIIITIRKYHEVVEKLTEKGFVMGKDMILFDDFVNAINRIIGGRNC